MCGCFFCRALESGDFLIDNRLAAARYDDFPVSPGHILVVPKRHTPDWWNATAEERDAMLKLLDEAKAIVDRELHPDGYNIGMNLGEAAGQSVMHLHLHLIPRYTGDCPNPKGGVRGVIPEKQSY